MFLFGFMDTALSLSRADSMVEVHKSLRPRQDFIYEPVGSPLPIGQWVRVIVNYFAFGE
jgi:hypothetical protein